MVRHVPDFPEPGVRFADLAPILGNGDALRCAVELLADEFVGRDVDQVAGVEARGFLLAAPLAYRLGCGLIPIRKPGKLPYETERIEYDLEYGSDGLEIHTDAVGAGARVLLIDDILATGGTAGAAAELLERQGASLVGIGFLAAIQGLGGAAALGGREFMTALGEI